MVEIRYFKNPENIYKNIYPKENGREINVYKYVDCIFTGINLYYPNVLMLPGLFSGLAEEHLILPVIEKTMSLNQSTIYETPEYGMKYDVQLSEEYTTYEDPVFFFVYNTDNYFHFLYDSLPYLISFLNIRKEIPNIKLLMQYPNPQKCEFYPFVLEFLEILGIKMSDITFINDKTRYNSVYISTSYTHDIDSNLPPRKEIYDFYRQMANDMVRMYTSVPTPPKIYVSRRTYIHNKLDNIGTNYTTRRRLVNEDELVAILSEQGFVEVFTENLTTIEKILYFANATHVVGAIGGGISNVLFSPKTTKLEALISPGFLDINMRFRYSLDCVDIHYNYNTKHVDEG
ncbi:glycosyltransferase family 61 protein, partial [bacterium]|nr:glycosyltransferase family 61 protein [bacterium]